MDKSSRIEDLVKAIRSAKIIEESTAKAHREACSGLSIVEEEYALELCDANVGDFYESITTKERIEINRIFYIPARPYFRVSGLVLRKDGTVGKRVRTVFYLNDWQRILQ